MGRLDRQVVVITGAGSGIGRALAVGGVREGARVVGLGRSADALRETAAQCQAGPGVFAAHACDVTSFDAMERVLRAVTNEHGGFDLLVNNAAIYPREAWSAASAAAWHDGVGTNLLGVVNGCLAAKRVLPPGRAAVILNVGSFAHQAPQAKSALYVTTKAAVNAFTRAAAVDEAASASKLVINEWIPGEYRTAMGVATGDDPALAFDRMLAVYALSQGHPGGRTFVQGEEAWKPTSRWDRIKSKLGR